ncbi:MAG: hypothetical protein QNJ98_15045 [Planctomycetota bacterium]|nr:hypothetical protein [Planctomycetota bacterium]
MGWITELLTRTSPWVTVLCLALFLVTGLWLGLRGARVRVERRTAGHRRLGRRGVARALKRLRRAGYRVLAEEVVQDGAVEVDGVVRYFRIRCDALVEKGGRTYVAELKGGAEAARIENRATRRQLLEYAWVFDAEAVLLVDADRGAIHRVAFPVDPPPRGAGQ